VFLSLSVYGRKEKGRADFRSECGPRKGGEARFWGKKEKCHRGTGEKKRGRKNHSLQFFAGEKGAGAVILGLGLEGKGRGRHVGCR